MVEVYEKVSIYGAKDLHSYIDSIGIGHLGCIQLLVRFPNCSAVRSILQKTAVL